MTRVLPIVAAILGIAAIMALVVYVLGAFTGGSLLALLRRSYAGARRTPAVSP